MNLIRYMASGFPGLTLEPPLFYRWPLALRFELNAESPKLSYFEAVHDRAKALYESVFAPNDKTIIASVADRYPGAGRSRHGSYTLFDLARKRNLGIGRPSGRHIHVRNPKHQEDHQAAQARILWTEVSPRTMDYSAVLDGIAHTAFPTVRFTRSRIGFPTGDRIYIINLSRNLIFHMYDDRGLDIMATQQATLQPIYEQHKSWLLDYDMERMTKTFETPSS